MYVLEETRHLKTVTVGQYAEGVTADFLTVGTQGCPHPSGFVCVSVS